MFQIRLESRPQLEATNDPSQPTKRSLTMLGHTSYHTRSENFFLLLEALHAISSCCTFAPCGITGSVIQRSPTSLDKLRYTCSIDSNACVQSSNSLSHSSPFLVIDWQVLFQLHPHSLNHWARKQSKYRRHRHDSSAETQMLDETFLIGLRRYNVLACENAQLVQKLLCVH